MKIVKILRQDLDSNNEWLECVGHIIYQIAKVFSFGNGSETFWTDSADVKAVNNLE